MNGWTSSPAELEATLGDKRLGEIILGDPDSLEGRLADIGLGRPDSIG